MYHCRSVFTLPIAPGIQRSIAMNTSKSKVLLIVRNGLYLYREAIIAAYRSVYPASTYVSLLLFFPVSFHLCCPTRRARYVSINRTRIRAVCSPRSLLPPHGRRDLLLQLWRRSKLLFDTTMKVQQSIAPLLFFFHRGH